MRARMLHFGVARDWAQQPFFPVLSSFAEAQSELRADTSDSHPVQGYPPQAAGPRCLPGWHMLGSSAFYFPPPSLVGEFGLTRDAGLLSNSDCSHWSLTACRALLEMQHPSLPTGAAVTCSLITRICHKPPPDICRGGRGHLDDFRRGMGFLYVLFQAYKSLNKSLNSKSCDWKQNKMTNTMQWTQCLK